MKQFLKLVKINKQSSAVKFVVREKGQEIGRVFLYLIYNDLHPEPYGLLEDVFVEEASRGRGIGSELVRAVIKEAKKRGCYKLIATSRRNRPKIHAWYKGLGLKKYGIEFRMDL